MKKWAMIIIVILSLAAVLAGGNWAWLIASVEPLTNRFTAGTVKVEIEEHGFEDLENWIPGRSAEKKISVKSSGSKATYVRISLTPVWGARKGKVFTADPGLPVDNIQYNYDSSYESNWVYHDGWHYYKSILLKGAETEPLLQSVTLKSPMSDDYKGKVLRIAVKAEAVQASHEVYKEAWGLQNLPPGVQSWSAP